MKKCKRTPCIDLTHKEVCPKGTTSVNISITQLNAPMTYLCIWIFTAIQESCSRIFICDSFRRLLFGKNYEQLSDMHIEYNYLGLLSLIGTRERLRIYILFVRLSRRLLKKLEDILAAHKVIFSIQCSIPIFEVLSKLFQLVFVSTGVVKLVLLIQVFYQFSYLLLTLQSNRSKISFLSYIYFNDFSLNGLFF